MRYILRILTSRIFNLILLISIQIILLMIFLGLVSRYKLIPAIITYIINAIVMLVVLNRKDDPSYRLLWTIVILILPYVGGAIYLLFADKKAPRSLMNMNTIVHYQKNIFVKKYKLTNSDNLENKIIKQFNYLQNRVGYPYYKNTNTKYYTSGEDAFNDILIDLSNAKHFIFLEFFIVDEGYMLDSILDILRKKVKENVKVYFMYDDAGCVTTLNNSFDRELRSYGIKCVRFSKLSPRLEIHMNNRNHRKILVIDNNIGYMGGFNIADEYINRKVKYGYWKDSGVRMEGEAVWNCTAMFIQFYNSISKVEILEFNSFKLPTNIKSNDVVCPFSDSPTDQEDVGHNVHMNLISNASRYVYIHTPYLVLDYTMEQTLILAAKNGVEVVITTPHIPDKKFVFEMTRSNYLNLIESGIKIYEFTPGFLHSKTIVVDDNIALIGTINMDYRSYFLHYECGTLITNKDSIEAIRDDYINTIKVSKEITLDDCRNVHPIKKLYRAILNIFAPMI